VFQNFGSFLTKSEIRIKLRNTHCKGVRIHVTVELKSSFCLLDDLFKVTLIFSHKMGLIVANNKSELNYKIFILAISFSLNREVINFKFWKQRKVFSNQNTLVHIM